MAKLPISFAILGLIWSMTKRLNALMAYVLLAFAPIVLGAAPKSTIEKLQHQAPEAIEVVVTKVGMACKIGGKLGGIQYTVTAKVVGVTRSKGGLKKGDTVTIFYQHPTERAVGDYPSVVEKEGRYRAFLKRSKDSSEKRVLYAPAAMSGTFIVVKKASS